MEIILAVVVASAVIFFGALISVGNERQRGAIDNLREQVALWAMQDLRIKRERLACNVHVDDPIGWLNKVAMRVCGFKLDLRVFEVVENPQVLICTASDKLEKVVFTPYSPREIRTMRRAKHNRLSQYVDRNPLLSLPRYTKAFECSVLNNGILFDLELPLVWKGLTGIDIDEKPFLWMYVVS